MSSNEDSSLDQEDVLLKEMEDSNKDSLIPQDAWMGKLNDTLGALASSMQIMQHSLSRLQPSFANEEDASSSEPAAKRLKVDSHNRLAVNDDDDDVDKLIPDQNADTADPGTLARPEQSDDLLSEKRRRTLVLRAILS